MTKIKILLCLRPELSEDQLNVVKNLFSWLLRRGVELYLLDEAKNYIKNKIPKMLEHIEFINLTKNKTIKPHFIISAGGDGTLIGAIHNFKGIRIPIFGINLGHLGFITEFNKSHFFDYLAKTILNDYELIEYPLYEVQVIKKGKVIFKDYFLNDVVCCKNDISRMFKLITTTNGHNLYHLSGDGVIISSPIGSTAYSLSAGGPIVAPETKAVILTPICAHGLHHKPMILPDHYSIEIKVEKDEKDILITLDGQSTFPLDPFSILHIKKHKSKKAHLVKNPEKTYFENLKEKFIHTKKFF